MKKIALTIAMGIFTVSGAFGANDGSALVDISGINDNTQGLPQFNDIKIVNDIPDYSPEVYLNEKKPNEKELEDDVQSMHVRTKKPGIAIPVAGGATVSALRLVLKDQNGKRMSSERKRVTWVNDNEAEELTNILAGKLKGINVTLKRDPNNKGTIVITIKKADQAEASKEATTAEGTSPVGK